LSKIDRDRSRSSHYRKGAFALIAVLAVSLAGSVVAADAVPSAPTSAKTIAETVCVACHGADGNSVIPMFPKIAGLQEEYIVKQLRDYIAGRRKSDIMGPIVAGLKPDDIAPLAAYFSGQKRKPGASENKAAASLGKLIFHDGNEETGVPACVGCHQAEGSGHNIYPRIAGQHVQYVTQQLKNFAAGERSNDPSRFMRITAKRMSEEEIQSVAEYLVGLGAN
jgi:cytochrome c553